MISKLHSNPILARLLHTVNYCLCQQLKGCKSILDLGCGPNSPLQNCKWLERSVGADAYLPYVEASQKKKIHTEYMVSLFEDLDFKPGEFDAVIMIDVLEHMSEEEGRSILTKAEKWAKKKVILTTPNGFFEQNEFDKNPFQKHLSGWTVEQLSVLGYKCWGLSGPKFLRKPMDHDSYSDSMLVTIKYNPQWFWFVVASVLQVIVYYLPKLAFGLLCVKELE